MVPAIIPIMILVPATPRRENKEENQGHKQYHLSNYRMSSIIRVTITWTVSSDL